jgi:hypothetical protein
VAGTRSGRWFNSGLGNRTGVLSDALGWRPRPGRTGRIAGSWGWIPHLSAGVRSGSKALSYIGLAQAATPPSPRRSSNLSARTRRNPHQPARPDARPLIFNKTVSWSALADCGLSVGRISGSPRWPAVPPTLQIVGTCRYLPTNRNISQLTLTWATTVLVEVARHDSSYASMSACR